MRPLALDLGRIIGIGPFGELNPADPSTDAITKLVTLISNFIGLITIIAGLWFLFKIFFSGFQWINAGGDKQTLQTAQKSLTNAVMGLIIVIAAYTLIGIVGLFLGLDILNIGDLIKSLAP